MASDPVDRALLDALSTATGGTEDGLTIDAVAEAAGLPVAVIEAVAREQLLHPVPGTDPPRFGADDVTVLRAATALLEAGLPLGELLDLARRTDQALRGVAEHAVEVFMDFVRDPVRGTADDPAAAGRRLVAAFETMLPASGELIGAHFRQLLVAAARDRVHRDGSGAVS